MFIKYINTYFKRIASYVIAAILILTSILPSLILYINTVSNNKAIAETKKATGYIVFDLLDEIINISADMVEGNKEFFLNNNNSEIEYIKISNEIRNIKNSCPYVERIVFYKKNDHRLLTDNGTIGKKDFFGKEYKNEKYNEEFWYNLLDTFQTPSIIPAVMYNSESGLDGHASRMFVVPNIYYIYNVGVLFFINEEKFIEYCGFNTNKECKIAFYNLNGDYIFGNTDKQLSILKVPEGSSTEELNLLGNYKMTSWFKYNDMVFQINIKNPAIPIVLFITILGNILIIIIIFEIMKRRRVNIATVTDSGIGMRTMLYACMNNPKLLDDNISILNQSVTSRNDSSYALYAVIFSNIADKRLVPEIKEANSKLPNSVMAIEKTGNVIVLFANIPISKLEIADKFVESEIFELADMVSSIAEVKIVRGMIFSDLSELATAYATLKNNLMLYKETEERQIVLPEFEKLRRELLQYIVEGKFSIFIEKIREELLNAQKSMSYHTYINYLMYVYFFVANMLENKSDFINDTFVLFAEGIKTNKYLYNSETVTNVLLNVLTNIKSYVEEKPENTERLKDIIGFINKNYKRDIGLDEIADNFGMKVKTLSAFLKRKLGISFIEYLSHLRIEEAKRLLLETDKPVKEILEEVGYISNSTFTMMFKKQVGKSPVQFRSENKIKTDN